MANHNTDSIRRREREARARKIRETGGEEFRETLAPPMPNQTYRDEVEFTESSSTSAEQVVRIVATILSSLLALRFLVSLFSSDRSAGLVNLFYGLTDWLVAPFQAIFGATPLSGIGFFDWPALAALIVVSVLAAFLGRLVRTPQV